MRKCIEQGERIVEIDTAETWTIPMEPGESFYRLDRYRADGRWHEGSGGCRQKDNRVQVGKFKMINPTESYITVKTNIQPFGCIDAQVMDYGIFFGILIVTLLVLTYKFHKYILIVQFPDTEIQFQKKVGRRIVA